MEIALNVKVHAFSLDPKIPPVMYMLMFQDVLLVVCCSHLEVIGCRDPGIPVSLMPPVNYLLYFELQVVEGKGYRIFIGFIARITLYFYRHQGYHTL